MKQRYNILTCVLILAFALADSVYADSYRIVRLSKSPIIIGGVKLTERATFDCSKTIEWTDDKQVMEVVNTTTGKHYTARRKVNPQKGRTIKDFILRTSYGSTRDTDEDITLTLATSPVGPEFPERRAALVIGNSNYEEMARLRNAQGDAAAVADELSTLGFDVMQLYEADERSMKNALRRFSKLTRGYDFVMFYFAGHGVQEDGYNYLLPVEARLEFKSELRNCLSADDVVQHLDALPATGRLVVLDACRNAHKSWTRSADEGLARMEAGEGTVILFSTQSGKTALDGEGEHSPFATALLANIKKPDMDFTHAINNVVRDTYFATDKQQYPLLVGSLLNDFAFNGGRDTATPGGSVKFTDSEIHEWMEKGSKAYDEKDYVTARKWLAKAAEQGDAEAQYKLGILYNRGHGVETNKEEALLWYQKAAEQGLAIAQCKLGDMYLYGLGDMASCNYAEALKWYEKAAAQGDILAQNSLGIMYLKGIGVTQDYAEAAKWYHKSAEQGDGVAQCALGVMYANGDGVARDYGEAVKWLLKSADQNNVAAQSTLAAMYDVGEGVAQNFEESAKWYRKAAEQGDTYSQYYLATYYFNGKGVPQNDTEAVKWYERAAEQGFPPAQCYLGYMYSRGRGVQQDYKRAVELYLSAANEGDHIAQYNVANMYADGKGVAQNFSLAVQWYRKSASRGFSAAQYSLGVMYANGQGVTRDNAEAAKWFRKAADQGVVEAQRMIGTMYAKGEGVNKDSNEARKWLGLAAAQGDKAAQEELAKLEE